MGQQTEITKLKQDTVRFLKETIETFCKKRGLIVRFAVDEGGVDHLNIVQQRCNLEYPGTGHSSHFYSGFSGSTFRKDGRLFLELKAHHTHHDGQKDWDAVEDLTALQELLESGAGEDLLRRRIETNLLSTLQAEEKALERFKRKLPVFIE